MRQLRRRGSREDGLTLIEVLITVVVMSIISLAALEGVTTIAGTTQDHRDVANLDAAIAAYAEAVKQHVNFSTTLTGPCAAAGSDFDAVNNLYKTTATKLCVADASELSSPVEIVVAGELMKVTNVASNVLTVTRADRGTAADTHTVGTSLNPLYTPCPPATQLTPIRAYAAVDYSYITSIGITKVEYGDPSTSPMSFGTHSACEAYFQNLCPTYSADNGTNWANTFQDSNQPACDAGIQRVTISASTPSTSSQSTGAAAHSVSSSTVVLVRRGTGG